MRTLQATGDLRRVTLTAFAATGDAFAEDPLCAYEPPEASTLSPVSHLRTV
jgi:hypothetical protein